MKITEFIRSEIHKQLKEQDIKFTKAEMAKLHKDGEITKKDPDGKEHKYIYTDESVNEGIKSTIQKLFKKAKKSLGMSKIVRPSDDVFNYTHDYVKRVYGSDYTLSSIGVDAIKDVIYGSAINDSAYTEEHEFTIEIPKKFRESVNEAKTEKDFEEGTPAVFGKTSGEVVLNPKTQHAWTPRGWMDVKKGVKGIFSYDGKRFFVPDWSKTKSFNESVNEDLPAQEIDPSEFPNPLPGGKKGFLKKGNADGDKTDDIVKTTGVSISVSQLKPSQDAIYLGKALGLAVGGVEGGDLGAVISKDNYILDGHHRYAATTFNNPSAKVGGVQSDLVIGDLVPVLRAVGDAMKNKRGLAPKGGDINIFKATMKDVKAAIYDGKNMDSKFYNKEKSIKWFERIGEETIAARLKMIQSKRPPGGAPGRKDMPKIHPNQLGILKTLLNKGNIDVKEPYAESVNEADITIGGKEYNLIKKGSKITLINTKWSADKYIFRNDKEFKSWADDQVEPIGGTQSSHFGISEEQINEAKEMTFTDYLKILDKRFVDVMSAVKGQNGTGAEIKPTRGDILQNFTLFRNYLSSLTKKYKNDKTKLKFLTEWTKKIDEVEQSVNEAIGFSWLIYTLLGYILFSVVDIADTPAELTFGKGSRSRFLIDKFKKILKNRKVKTIVDKLKTDPEVIDYAKKRKPGWRKMLANKLDAEDKKLLNNIYRTHFNKKEVEQSVNEGIKKGDFVKNFSGELGLVNKVSGRTAYVKFPSTGSKSFDTVFVQYLKPSSEKHKGKMVYIEESVNRNERFLKSAARNIARVLRGKKKKGYNVDNIKGYITSLPISRNLNDVNIKLLVQFTKDELDESTNEETKRDYKKEYAKYGKSEKAKKYRAELNKYNRDKGTYGNGDGKDASHKGGKIVGFEDESKNRGRREKSRLKKESVNEKRDSATKKLNSKLTIKRIGNKQVFKDTKSGKTYSKNGFAFHIQGKGYVGFKDGKGIPYIPGGGKNALQSILDQGGFLNYKRMVFVNPVNESVKENMKLNESMLKFVRDQASGGMIAGVTGLSKYKDIDTARTLMIQILKKKNLKYSRGEFEKLGKQVGKFLSGQRESVNEGNLNIKGKTVSFERKDKMEKPWNNDIIDAHNKNPKTRGKWSASYDSNRNKFVADYDDIAAAKAGYDIIKSMIKESVNEATRLVGTWFYDTRYDEPFIVKYAQGNYIGIEYKSGKDVKVHKKEFDYKVKKGAWNKWKQPKESVTEPVFDSPSVDANAKKVYDAFRRSKKRKVKNSKVTRLLDKTSKKERPMIKYKDGGMWWVNDTVFEKSKGSYEVESDLSDSDIMDDLGTSFESVTEAKSTKKGNTYYVDTDFINLSKKGGKLHHSGFGDFEVEVKGGGLISFIRVSEKIPGFSGRTHRVAGNDDDFKKLSKLMGVKSESVNEAMSKDAKFKIYDKLKKGDKITIKYDSSIQRGHETTFVVSKGKTKVGKAKVERIILKRVDNPKGVKYYLYQRDGSVTLAMGNMAASIVDMSESVVNENRIVLVPTKGLSADKQQKLAKGIFTYMKKNNKINLDYTKKNAVYTSGGRGVYIELFPKSDSDSKIIRKAVDYLYPQFEIDESVNENKKYQNMVDKAMRKSDHMATVAKVIMKVSKKLGLDSKKYFDTKRNTIDYEQFIDDATKKDSTNEQGLTFHKSAFGKSVNEAKFPSVEQIYQGHKIKWIGKPFDYFGDGNVIKKGAKGKIVAPEVPKKGFYLVAMIGSKGKEVRFYSHLNKFFKLDEPLRDPTDESVTEAKKQVKFSKQQLDTLRKGYAKINSIDPAKPTYEKITDLLDSLSLKGLKQLANAKIKWISPLALNRVNRFSKKESVNEAMLSPKAAKKLKIGNTIKTQKGTYKITGYGQKTGATRNFEAEKDGQRYNLRVSLRGTTSIEVAKGRSLNFTDSEMLESVNEGKKEDFKVLFWKRGNPSAAHTQVFSVDNFDKLLSMVVKLAKQKGYVYIKVGVTRGTPGYSTIGTLDKKDGWKFKKGDWYSENPLKESVNEGKLPIDYNKKEENQWRKIEALIKKIDTEKKAKDFIEEYANYVEKLYRGERNYENLVPNAVNVIANHVQEFPDEYPLSDDIWWKVTNVKVRQMGKNYLKGKHFVESVNEAQKSPAAKMVLQLMDKDPDGGGNYEVALKKALTKFKNVNKTELEKELDLYI